MSAPTARRFTLTVIGWLLLDQLSKLAVLAHFGRPGGKVVLIPGWLDLTLTYNRGAAFGLLNDVDWSKALFIVIATAALGAVVYWRHAILALPPIERYGLALVAGGAAGNLVDRLFRDGRVVDFIHFHIDRIGFVWPDFNLADTGVTCGMLLYIAHAVITDLAHRQPADETAPAADGDAA